MFGIILTVIRMLLGINQRYKFSDTNINLNINSFDLYLYIKQGKLYSEKEKKINDCKTITHTIAVPFPIPPWPPPRLSSSLLQFNEIDQKQ